jgi:MFS transporter, ACS family, hexuronate transporter
VHSSNTQPAAKRRIPYLRWCIIAVCFLGTTINYIDRQCLSVAADTISKEFHFTASDYGSIVMAFMIAYTIMQFVSGAVVDRIGVRWGMAIFATWWSAAAMLHALCRGLWSFRAARFMLGMGEAGNWPSATKAVSEWFPARERGMAVAIFDSGSGVGGLIAAPLVAWLIAYCGWQCAFIATGALVMPWLALWLWIYRSPEQHARITDAELQRIQAGSPPESNVAGSAEPWYLVLASRNAWAVVLGRLLTDCIWWFYVYWLAKYLADVRGFGLADLGKWVGIPFIAVDFGNLAGGGLSCYLLRRNWSLNAARKCVLLLSAVGMLASIPAVLTSHAGLCIALITLVTFSYSAWGTIMLTLPTDLFPSRQTGTVSGLSGTGAGVGGIISAWLIGVVVDRFSYTSIFITAGLMPIVALGVVQILVPHIGHERYEKTASDRVRGVAGRADLSRRDG